MYIPRLLFCVRDFAHTPQMTGTRLHDEDSTTLRVQPCRTAAVVGYIYVRARGESSLCCGELCRSLSSVTPPHSNSSRIHHVRARGESSLCCGELLL